MASVITRVLKIRRGRLKRNQSEGKVAMEESSERCKTLKIEKRGHEPRNVDGFWKLEKAKK